MKFATRAGGALLIVGLTLASTANTALACPVHPAVQRVLDRATTEAGLPGILAEIRDEHGRWFGTAGTAELGTNRKRRAQDRFRIGSTAKTFTATVLLQLVAEGTLSLDDTVEKWLPGVVHGNGHDGSRITVRQLLNQTSGIFNYAMDPELVSQFFGLPFLRHRFDTVTPEQLVRIAMRHPPAFAPGTDWGYSNTNYTLVGLIIERASGSMLADQITRRIIRPLGLSGTYVPPADDPSIHGPHGRHYSKLMLPNPDAAIYDVTEQSPSGGWAAGDLISTVGDLDRFFGALLSGKLLPPAEQLAMFMTIPTHGWIDHSTYGLGMSSVTLACGTTVWGMGGALNGSWAYTYGTRDGGHLLSTNVNGDWAGGTWQNPIGVFTDVLQAEFCPPN